jgi:catecholate siderophore receptor
VDFHNNRTNADLSSVDDLVSPRVGVIFKPSEPVSIYTTYSLAYLPRAGEQLSSLSLTNQALDPEKFTDYEVGAKWDIHPALSFTGAVYAWIGRTSSSRTQTTPPARSWWTGNARRVLSSA